MRNGADAITIRDGQKTDLEAMLDAMFVEPSREAVALSGTAARARAFQRELLVRALGGTARILVAEVKGGVVGFALTSTEGDVPPPRELAVIAIRAMGVGGTLRAAWRASARRGVDLRPPHGGLHLVELHVAPEVRGMGVGGELLSAVEDRARLVRAAHISLTTGSTNPARRLYRRHGYDVVAERRAARYARLTGIPGRVLMLKPLD